MKTVIDIDELLADKKITAEEHERLKALSNKEADSMTAKVLIFVGVTAIVAGVLALLPYKLTWMILGPVLVLAGASVTIKWGNNWSGLAGLLLLGGAMTSAIGIMALTEGWAAGFVVFFVCFTAGAVLTKSRVLAVMAAFSLVPMIGRMIGSGAWAFLLPIRQPTVTIVLFSVLALAFWFVSRRLPTRYQKGAIAFSRASGLIANIGFWCGSLWGDSLWNQSENWDLQFGTVISSWAFAVAWAVAIFWAGLWAFLENKRWAVNLVIVLATIHFYTQYFNRLGATPSAVLVAGLLGVFFAMGVLRVNKAPNLSPVRVNLPIPNVKPGK